VTRLGWGILTAFVILLLAFVAMLGPARQGSTPAPAGPVVGSASVGALTIPVVGVAPDQLVDSFGDARGGGGRIHGAIDIPAPRGTTVIAAGDGRAEKLFESRLGGHTLYERSTDGATLYYYAHLDGYAPGIAEGLVLHRGQPIGFVGSSGDADPSAPHLHFEVHRMAPGERWWQGSAVNPYPLLAADKVAR
jgi:murein DD-endopeptidase MepM/ murein hydrolase activator NlpD